MVFGNFIGAKMAEIFSPLKAVIISLSLMVMVLLINFLVAANPVAILILTFIIGIVSFMVGTPIQLAIIKASKGSEMLGSSMNQSAFNMGNASGAFFAGLPIAMGFGFTSASLVGALMAGTGITIAVLILVFSKNRAVSTKRKMAFNS